MVFISARLVLRVHDVMYQTRYADSPDRNNRKEPLFRELVWGSAPYIERKRGILWGPEASGVDLLLRQEKKLRSRCRQRRARGGVKAVSHSPNRNRRDPTSRVVRLQRSI